MAEAMVALLIVVVFRVEVVGDSYLRSRYVRKSDLSIPQYVWREVAEPLVDLQVVATSAFCSVPLLDIS